MIKEFRKPYNLKKLSKDLKSGHSKILALSHHPHQKSKIIKKIDLSQISTEDARFIPTTKFNTLGAYENNLYFYDELISSPYYEQLQSKELANSINDFLVPYQSYLTSGEFFFHGSALTSIILKHLGLADFSYENINILCKINSFEHPEHSSYYKLPRPLNSKDNTNKENYFAHIGSETSGKLCFDYAISLSGEKLNLKNFLNNQAFNYSEVYFDYETSSLHWGEGFLEFLDSLSIKIKTDNFNLDAFLHAHRISQQNEIKFYARDYLPLFIKNLESFPRNKKSILHSVWHFSSEGTSLYNTDTVRPMLGQIKKKNQSNYCLAPAYSWLQPSSLDKSKFIIKTTEELISNLPLYENGPEGWGSTLSESIGELYEDFGIHYQSLPANFLPYLKDYLAIGGKRWKKVSLFWFNFIFSWRHSPASKHSQELSLIFSQHPFLRDRFFELAHYRGIITAWAFFDKLISFKRRESVFFKFIGFLENNLSLIIHRNSGGDLFEHAHDAFKIRSKSHPDRFLIFPLQLPWYFKPLVYELKTVHELEVEGERMKHCVAGYDSKIERQMCRVFHLHTKNGSSTLELDNNFKIIQHKGKLNSDPSEKNIKLSLLLIKLLKKKYEKRKP